MRGSLFVVPQVHLGPVSQDEFLIASGARVDANRAIDRQDVEKARANALSIAFATFKSQVLAFLPPEDQIHYDSPVVWDTLVLEVAEALHAVGP